MADFYLELVSDDKIEKSDFDLSSSGNSISPVQILNLYHECSSQASAYGRPAGRKSD